MPAFVEIVAVYSRSEASARALADELGATPKWGDEGLESILDDPSIVAVDVVLPINVQPDIVERALKKGKYVLSEKPCAPRVADAKDVDNKKWAVAENYRLEQGITALAGVFESVNAVRIVVGAPITAENPYAKTEWRKTPEHIGGFFGDAGVHYLAALRLIAHSRPLTVCAMASPSQHAHLPSPDTIKALVSFDTGLIATLDISFRPTVVKRVEFAVDGTTTKGSLTSARLTRTVFDKVHGYSLHVDDSDDQFFAFTGIDRELDAFFNAVRQQLPVPASLAPRESLADLALLEAILDAADQGTSVPVSSPL